jgi:hypothetical protein
MQDNDPLIGGILFGIEMLVRQVSWTVQPGDDSAQGEQLARFVEDCLHDMHLTWPDTLGEILTFLPWGFSVHEQVFKRRPDGKVGWWGWPLRGQESLLHWEFDDHYVPTAMVQLGPPDWHIHTIPLSKCLHFRTSVRKNNPEGRSLLRNAYTSWYYKKQIQTLEAIGVERDLAGFPVMRIPAEIMKSETPADQATYLAYQQAVINLRRDEQEGLILPSDRDPDSHEYLYDIQLLTSGGTRQMNTDAIIARYDQRIAMAMLADFMMLGHEAVGTQALGASKIDLFVKAMDAWLSIITAQVNGKAIPDLLRYNGLDVDGLKADGALPKLAYEDIGDVDLASLGQYLTALTGAGVPLDLDPAGPLVKRLMSLGNLPEAPQGTDFDDLVEQQRKLAEAKAPPKPPMAGDGPNSGAGNGGRPAAAKRATETDPAGAAA